jgi:hypothetical protein
MASYHPEDGQSSSDDGETRPKLPFRVPGASHAAHTEARAELRDRETYYIELRLAVRGQSRFVPRPRTALDDGGSTDEQPGADNAGTEIRSDGESGDGMTAQFDTWT